MDTDYLDDLCDELEACGRDASLVRVLVENCKSIKSDPIHAFKTIADSDRDGTLAIPKSEARTTLVTVAGTILKGRMKHGGDWGDPALQPTFAAMGLREFDADRVVSELFAPRRKPPRDLSVDAFFNFRPRQSKA